MGLSWGSQFSPHLGPFLGFTIFTPPWVILGVHKFSPPLGPFTPLGSFTPLGNSQGDLSFSGISPPLGSCFIRRSEPRHFHHLFRSKRATNKRAPLLQLPGCLLQSFFIQVRLIIITFARVISCLALVGTVTCDVAFFSAFETGNVAATRAPLVGEPAFSKMILVTDFALCFSNNCTTWRVQWRGSLDESPQPASSLNRNKSGNYEILGTFV